MAVSTDFAALLNNLKLQDPWLPPTSWESIPAENGLSTSLSSPTSKRLYDTSAVSEASLVRLAMNGLQGLESSLTSIDKVCAIFRSDSTDRTYHRIPSLWNQSVSTLGLEKILRSLGCKGCEVLLVRKFIDHFTNLSGIDATGESYCDYPPYSLVNQAFAVAVRDVLEGYISALDTLSSSVGLRRLSSTSTPTCTSSGCLSSVGHSEVTLLEVYLHTKELTSQIEVIGSICNVHNLAVCFSLSPLEDLNAQTNFSHFPRGANLLTFLYMELKVADPVHCALLKTLFIRSCEPYFEFIRSWIFKAKIIDPFNEFIVAEADSQQSCSLSNTGVLVDLPAATIREQDGVSVPCFLRDLLIPLFRAGQQLQILIKLLEFSDGVGSWNRTYEDFLPYWSRLSCSRLSLASHLSFTKEGIERMVLSRTDYYKIMMEKLDNHLPNLEFKYHQVIPQSTCVSNGRGDLEVASAAKDIMPAVGTVDSDTSEDSSSGEEEIDESESESETMVEVFHDSEEKYLSVLEISSDTSFCTRVSPSKSSGWKSSCINDQLDSELCERNPHGDGLECGNKAIVKLRDRCSKVSLPCYEFRSIRDPFTECVDRLGRRRLLCSPNKTNSNTSITMMREGKGEAAPAVKKKTFIPPPVEKNVSGGGCWEHLLDASASRPAGQNISITAPALTIPIPLDFVLQKCLLEEIQLQYVYVSKLTIKLLEEAFSLQQHLLALRRYHMMESADWADLFIVSLSHHKWYTTEADKRISEIQGLLELSLQRSSCETDSYKDRLFVYMKQQSLPATVTATGMQSLNVLGLGYRVDWPVSIVLTPAALKIYAQIFTFLIQLKLSLSSLTQVWCSLKEFIHHHHHSDLRKSHFNIMVKLRHGIFHFVSTLQQYVQSQLSHVSWCRFLQSLRHKVKDLTDLDFVHMDYLSDSQCICFLSNDMKQTADIIQSILQCALDLRSVVVPNTSAKLNIAEVLRIKEAFDGNIRKLYGCYLASPKNVEFSLPRFWEYLNYNGHYSDVIANQPYHVFT